MAPIHASASIDVAGLVTSLNDSQLLLSQCFFFFFCGGKYVNGSNFSIPVSISYNPHNIMFKLICSNPVIKIVTILEGKNPGLMCTNTMLGFLAAYFSRKYNLLIVTTMLNCS